MIITVTAQHIEKGHMGCGGSCPIALAFLDAIQDAISVFVGPNHAAYIHTKAQPIRIFELTSGAFTWLSDYDRGKTVKPFSFKAIERTGTRK